jgi:hypothetical protein
MHVLTSVSLDLALNGILLICCLAADTVLCETNYQITMESNRPQTILIKVFTQFSQFFMFLHISWSELPESCILD